MNQQKLHPDRLAIHIISTEPVRDEFSESRARARARVGDWLDIWLIPFMAAGLVLLAAWSFR